MPIALISVSDKSGVAEFAGGLAERGWEIVSTGGTARALAAAGVPVREVAALTGFPEILGGRVKTLHPAVHAGLLARRGASSDLEELERQGLPTIDLVAVNLYPFRETVARPSTTLAEALEQVDIGGPTMLRAAAKNHRDVWAVCDPADYGSVLAALDGEGDAAGLRRRLARRVFQHTATYDAAIASYLEPEGGAADAGLPEEILCSLARVQSLRYGENPDQAAAFYREAGEPEWGIPALQQLHGKELSYNNILDVDAGLTAVDSFEGTDGPACIVIKHATPCGVALGRSPLEAFQKAWGCDPLSAFGSTVVLNDPVTEALGESISELFVECLVAPGFAGPALERLRRKKNLRILDASAMQGQRLGRGHLRPGMELRGVRGAILAQEAPRPAPPARFREAEGVRVASRREPTEREWSDLAFAWAAVTAVKSNAILLGRDGASIGIGAGQMSRVDAVRIAIRKARDAEHPTEGAALASDAFFPFRDNIDVAAEAGIAAIVQPGGSIRDEEVVEAVDDHGMTMVFTGRRLFRH